MRYIWYFRILYNKSVIVCNSDSFVPLLQDCFRASLQPGSMDKVNSSVVSEFVLLGLSSSRELQLFFCVLLCVICGHCAGKPSHYPHSDF